MHSMNDYYSAIQLRSDRWSALRDATGALARGPSEKAADKLHNTAADLLASLAIIEPYWAFPGVAAFEHMRRQFELKKYEDIAFSVKRVTRALTTGAYRRRTIPLERDSVDAEEHEDEALVSLDARAMSKPYFEVLIVDDVNEHQERWLKSNVARMRRPEDQFLYEAVVVPSLEDALIAVLFNHNIQAVVVRPGLTLKSNTDQTILTKYLNRAGGQDEIEALLPEDYGPELCRLIARVRPELDAYLVTERSVEEIAGHDLGICRRVFYNQEDFMELHLNILRGVQARNKTPFFHRPCRIFQAADRCVSRDADQPWQVHHTQPLDPGYGCVLRAQHLSG